jgi:hypothetical protein
LSTIYRVDRVALGDRWLTCRRGLIFVGMRDHSAWHAVIYDLAPVALEGLEGEGPLTFAAVTPDGFRLWGMAQLGRSDAQTRMLYIAGVGPLHKSAQTIAPLQYVRAGDNAAAAKLRRR